jgi:copper chaperone CopZ
MIQKETVLDVQGMSCPSCIRHIREALNDVEGVSAVDVRLADGWVMVKHDLESSSVGQLVEALRDAGYESSPRNPG